MIIERARTASHSTHHTSKNVCSLQMHLYIRLDRRILKIQAHITHWKLCHMAVFKIHISMKTSRQQNVEWIIVECRFYSEWNHMIKQIMYLSSDCTSESTCGYSIIRFVYYFRLIRQMLLSYKRFLMDSIESIRASLLFILVREDIRTSLWKNGRVQFKNGIGVWWMKKKNKEMYRAWILHGNCRYVSSSI